MPLPEGFDAADPKSDPLEGRSALLAGGRGGRGAHAAPGGRSWRGPGWRGAPLAEVAKALGRRPRRVYKDRDRAENALAAFARSLRRLGVGTMTERVPDARDVLGVELRGRPRPSSA